MRTNDLCHHLRCQNTNVKGTRETLHAEINDILKQASQKLVYSKDGSKDKTQR